MHKNKHNTIKMSIYIHIFLALFLKRFSFFINSMAIITSFSALLSYLFDTQVPLTVPDLSNIKYTTKKNESILICWPLQPPRPVHPAAPWLIIIMRHARVLLVAAREWWVFCCCCLRRQFPVRRERKSGRRKLSRRQLGPFLVGRPSAEAHLPSVCISLYIFSLYETNRNKLGW